MALDNFDVFLSCSALDQRIGQKIKLAIERTGLVVRGSWGGGIFSPAGEKTDFNAIYFICCISGNYVSDELCVRDINLVFSADKVGGEIWRSVIVLPLLIDEGPEFSDILPHDIFKVGFRVFNGDHELVAQALMKLDRTSPESCGSDWGGRSGDFSVDGLERLHSWLSEKRKSEIAKAACEIVSFIRDHRYSHIRGIKHSERIVDSSYPAWTKVSITDSRVGFRLIVGFTNTQCYYRAVNKIGCFNCGFYAGSKLSGKASARDLIEQFRKSIIMAGRAQFDVIEFLSDGSFLNGREVDEEGAFSIFSHIASMPHVVRVLIESTPEHVYMQGDKIVKLLRCLRRDQTLEIGIGLETSDDFIRKACINKGFSREQFEWALTTISRINASERERVSVVSYLIVKPAFLSVSEAISDVINTLKYLQSVERQLGVRISPKIEPGSIADGTALSYLYQFGNENLLGKYEPFSYWGVVEVLVRAFGSEATLSIAKRLRIGAREDMDDVLCMPAIYKDNSRYDRMDFIVYDAVQKFNQHHDLLIMFAAVFSVGANLIDMYGCSDWGPGEWEKSQLKDSSSAVRFISDNRSDIKKSMTSISQSESKMYFVTRKVLDVIEGNDLRSGETYKRIVGIVRSHDGEIEKRKRVEREIEVCYSLFDVSFVKVEVNDLKVEKFTGVDAAVRVFFDVIELTSRVYIQLWALLPLKGGLDA